MCDDALRGVGSAMWSGEVKGGTHLKDLFPWVPIFPALSERGGGDFKHPAVRDDFPDVPGDAVPYPRETGGGV